MGTRYQGRRAKGIVEIVGQCIIDPDWLVYQFVETGTHNSKGSVYRTSKSEFYSSYAEVLPDYSKWVNVYLTDSGILSPLVDSRERANQQASMTSSRKGVLEFIYNGDGAFKDVVFHKL